jgi:propanol-preferring alcohol dehydrogenase
MRGRRLITPGPIQSRPLEPFEAADLDTAPDELAIQVAACGVCRTDLQLIEGDLAARLLPVVPGHQVVGTIIAAGSRVTDWQVGERVGVAWLAGTCGTCRFCLAGSENLCEAAEFTGWDRDGGYATQMTLRADFALRVPPGFGDVEAAPLLCGGVIGYRSLRLSGIQPGGRLGLYGFGASALLAIQVAIYWGCEVFVATRSVPEQQRALDMGAVWTGSYHDRPPVPLDAAVTFAPASYVVIEALKSLDRGGTVAVNAIHLDQIPEFPYEMLWWERSVRSVANFTRADAQEFLDLAARIPIRTVADPYRMEDANLALARLKAGDAAGAAVLTMAGTAGT